jgi:hypothetical protein
LTADFQPIRIAFSVGWLRSVAGFLVLSIGSMTTRNAEIVRAAYIAQSLHNLTSQSQNPSAIR